MGLKELDIKAAYDSEDDVLPPYIFSFLRELYYIKGRQDFSSSTGE